jgi:hypothetical protein
MDINYTKAAKIFIFTLISALTLTQTLLSAESTSKAEAVNKALTQAESKAVPKQKTEEIFPQKLDEIVTTKEIVEKTPKNEIKNQTKTTAQKQPAPYQSFPQRLWQRVTSEEAEGEGARPSELDTVVTFIPSRGAKSQSGKVGLIETQSEYSYDLKAFGKLPVEISIGENYIGIDNTTKVTLPSRLTAFAFGANILLPFFKLDKTYLRIGAAPSFATNNWSFASNAFRIPINTILIYHPNEQFTGILGVHITPSSVESRVSPIVGVIYKPNDKITYNLVGPQPNITYMVNKKLGFFAEGKIFDQEFVVTKDNIKNVVLIFKEYLLGGGVLYKINNFAETSLSVGGVFSRYLKYRDESDYGKVSINNGLYTEFRLDLSW